MLKNVASQKIALFAFDYSTGAPKTGDAANITPYINKDWAGVNALTDTSASELSSTNAPGWYLFDVSQTETNADVVHFTAKSSTANVAIVGTLIYTDLEDPTVALSTQGKADVNAEVLDVLNVDTFAQPGQENPAATTTLRLMLAYIYKAWRNRSTMTSSEYALYADNGTTKDQEATFSDNGTTADRGEVGTGA